MVLVQNPMILQNSVPKLENNNILLLAKSYIAL